VFTESLTLRILGDSSGLRRELDGVLGQLDSFRQKVADLSSTGQQLAKAFSGLSQATAPLQQVSKLLTQITQQVRTLGQAPLSLNIQPALNALQRLTAAIDAIAARLRAIAVFPSPGRPVGPAAPASPAGPILPPKYAAGGLVTGPPGLDQVPALLTAGEFVLNRHAAATLGADVLHSLNATPASTSPVTTSTSATNNHFGGITINVRESADVNNVVRDLRLQGIHLRNRRG
jgi:hypothetical protein